MAFYVVRGWRLKDLAALDSSEKVFLGCARDLYYKEIGEIITGLFGKKWA